MMPFKTVRQDWVGIPLAKADDIIWTVSPDRYNHHINSLDKEHKGCIYNLKAQTDGLIKN